MNHAFVPWLSPGGHVRCHQCGGYPVDHSRQNSDLPTDITFIWDSSLGWVIYDYPAWIEEL